MADTLDRRLGLTASVAVGMSAMVGAGLFVVFAPAVEAAGDGIVLALTIAAAVAACNAISSARLARRHPVAGGTYVYGRERLGPFWGHLAGWAFVAGKLASCAVMALAVGTYLWPDQARWTALAVLAVVTAVNLAGVQKSARAGIVLLAPVLVVVIVSIIVMSAAPGSPGPAAPADASGVLQAAGLLFFAFAGYARLATLGEEVVRPERTIPLAIAIAVVVVVGLYAAAALALVHVLGTDVLAGDVVTGIAFSSFCVLVYYAVANTAALTLRSSRSGVVVAALGLLGCAVLATTLPGRSVLAGSAVVALGALSYVVRTRWIDPRRSTA